MINKMLIFASLLGNIILILIIALIIGGALIYIIKAKKKGQKCIGCPYSKVCSSKRTNNNDVNCNGGSETSCCYKEK